MWPLTKSAVVVAEPPETDVDRLAKASAEVIFAEGAFDSAVRDLRAYNDAHRQMPFSYTTGDVTRIQTMASDAVRRRLEKDVRTAIDRRNKALSARANLMMRLGLIR